nr:unnamed protein product [Spirometra erinaceieuropaei]
MESSRNKLQVELMNLMNDNQYLSEGRFGELLLLIPTLQRVAKLLVMKIAAARRDGLHVDELLCDILLGEEIRVPLMLPTLDAVNMQLEGSFNENANPADCTSMGFRGEVRQELELTEWRPVDGGSFPLHQPLASCPDRNDVDGHNNSWMYENMPLSTEAHGYKQPPACLRRILNPRWQDGIPDTEFLEQINILNIHVILRELQLSWGGHIVRMEETRAPKQLFHGDVTTGILRLGGPKRCYKGMLKNTLKESSINPETWEDLVQNRRTYISADIYEANWIAAAKAKRTVRKSQVPPFRSMAT